MKTRAGREIERVQQLSPFEQEQKLHADCHGKRPKETCSLCHAYRDRWIRDFYRREFGITL